MDQQQKHLKSQAAQLQDLEDKLAREAAARQAQSAELTVLRDRCDTLRTQVVTSPGSTSALLGTSITSHHAMVTLSLTSVVSGWSHVSLTSVVIQ